MARPAYGAAAFTAVAAFVVFAAFTKLPVDVVVPAVACITAAVAVHKTLLRWRGQITVILLTILFVPMRRYALPGNLPFELELYRLVVGIVAMFWMTSLLIDPRVRLRRSMFERPLAMFIFALLASEIANTSRVNVLEGEVVKRLSYFASFLIVLALIVGVTKTLEDVDKLLKVLVGCGAFVALASLYESRTGYNVFNQLSRVIPILNPIDLPDATYRDGLIRAMGSSQHPIELGAVLVMLVPPAFYLARRTQDKRWWLAAGSLTLGTLACVARTSILMLLVVFVVFLILRPVETRRLWPAIVIGLVLAQVAVPGAIGTIKDSFFPEGGLLAEQSAHPGWEGSGRVADLGPALAKASKKPLFGEGFGTRIVDSTNVRKDKNANILDNQWLGLLLETGLAGVFALGWIFSRAIRQMGRAARRDRSDRGWALAALTASLASFAVGMFTFDAFSFVQVTFLFWILLALGGCLLQIRPEPALAVAPVPVPSPLPQQAPAAA